jgi:hypothetical protein
MTLAVRLLQSTDLGNLSTSHNPIRQGSCQIAPQMRSTKGALPNPPDPLTGISMIPSETRFPPIRGSGYETRVFRNLPEGPAGFGDAGKRVKSGT